MSTGQISGKKSSVKIVSIISSHSHVSVEPPLLYDRLSGGRWRPGRRHYLLHLTGSDFDSIGRLKTIWKRFIMEIDYQFSGRSMIDIASCNRFWLHVLITLLIRPRGSDTATLGASLKEQTWDRYSFFFLNDHDARGAKESLCLVG